MSVVIRLARRGAKASPIYRIVAADKKFPRDGRFLDNLGIYNPKLESDAIKIDIEKIQSWVKKGAKMSKTVKSLLTKIPSDNT